MCAPAAVIVPIVSAVASVGLGIYSAVSGAQEARAQADYNYQVQQAQAEYQRQEAQRQADFAFRQQLVQSETLYQQQLTARQYEYNQQLMQYNYQAMEQQRQYEYEKAVNLQTYEYQKAQVDAARRFEAFREEQQKSVMELNADLASLAYGNDLRLLDVRFMQEEEAAAQQKLKASREMAQERATIRASGRTGNTVDNLIADYVRQQAQFDYATNRNLAFTGADIQEQKRGAQSRYAERLGKEQPYVQQPYTDPVMGMALEPGAGVKPVMGPMPIRQTIERTTVSASPVYKQYVSMTPYWIQGVGSALTGGLNTVTAFDNYNQYQSRNPGRTQGSGRTGPPKPGSTAPNGRPYYGPAY